MQAEMNRHGGDIIASSFDHETFVTLRFKQGANEMTLYLDKGMAKAAATIVVVFNEFASGGSISDANDRVIRETDDEANAAASMEWVNTMRAGLGLPPIDYGKPDLPWQFKVSDSNTGPIIGNQDYIGPDIDPDKYTLGSTIDLDAAMKVEGGE